MSNGQSNQATKFTIHDHDFTVYRLMTFITRADTHIATLCSFELPFDDSN